VRTGRSRRGWCARRPDVDRVADPAPVVDLEHDRRAAVRRRGPLPLPDQPQPLLGPHRRSRSSSTPWLIAGACTGCPGAAASGRYSTGEPGIGTAMSRLPSVAGAVAVRTGDASAWKPWAGVGVCGRKRMVCTASSATGSRTTGAVAQVGNTLDQRGNRRGVLAQGPSARGRACRRSIAASTQRRRSSTRVATSTTLTAGSASRSSGES
jgi:hypothetical protein